MANVHSVSRHTVVQEVSSMSKIDQEVVDDVLTSLREVMVRHLKVHESINFYGFGTYRMNRYTARTGVNPATGEPWEIDSHYVAHFKPSRVLNSQLN